MGLKLRNIDAWEIRILRAAGFTQQDLADAYEVGSTCILDIVHGRTYRSAGGPLESVGAQRRKTATPKMRPHGTVSRYMHGCHCEECLEANRAKSRKWRARKKRNDAGKLSGSSSGLGVHGDAGEVVFVSADASG